MSALSMSIVNKNIDIAMILISHGANNYFSDNDKTKDFSPIFLAVEIEDADLIETMCDHGCSLEVKNSNL